MSSVSGDNDAAKRMRFEKERKLFLSYILRTYPRNKLILPPTVSSIDHWIKADSSFLDKIPVDVVLSNVQQLQPVNLAAMVPNQGPLPQMAYRKSIQLPKPLPMAPLPSSLPPVPPQRTGASSGGKQLPPTPPALPPRLAQQQQQQQVYPDLPATPTSPVSGGSSAPAASQPRLPPPPPALTVDNLKKLNVRHTILLVIGNIIIFTFYSYCLYSYQQKICLRKLREQ